ncbi:chordin-like protein 2 [Sinocyclocheilus grahami]|uniref:chordin-like protein 2 n=1 Tax=Sinocyclocheilus grahami TaxID=75366 RepID=UPI0007AD12A1|nr:PREDICTED: chordin-like protein 2 [Sinocyclocheilus grahami]
MTTVSWNMKKRMTYLKHFFILVTMRCFVQCETEAIRPGKMSGVFCIFKEKAYSPGESWHPYLEPFGFMFCMRCTCTEFGHVKCNSIKCPVLQCENPVTNSQQCCPRCADEHRTPAGLRAPIETCRYNGSTYQTGETFANHELFPSRQPNQCVMCTCSRHSVDQCAAEQVRGHSLRATPSTLRGSPRGLNLQTLHLKGAAATTVKILLQRKHQRACVYSGKTYSHGDVWHPVLGKVLECILCTCRDGFQECRRITCPNQYPCQHPIKIEGKCCKICPELKAESNRTECYLTQDNNSLLVYKVEPPSAAQSEDKVRTIAIERQGATEVEVQVWKTVEGVLHLMETGDVQKKDLIEHPENYILLTTLDEVFTLTEITFLCVEIQLIWKPISATFKGMVGHPI